MFSDSDGISFRTAQPADEPLLFDLFCTVRAPQFAQAGLTAQQQLLLLRHQFTAMHSSYAERYPHGNHFVIEVDSQAVGRVYINESHDELRLLDIIITPARRNQGIGAKVLQQMVAYSGATAKPIRFYVWEDNHAAQRFYERLGFQQIRNEQSYLLYERLP